MTHWLPTLPASAIDSESVDEFLRAGHGESNTHEYKLVGETKRLSEVVSALANTYGGIVIVGVPDKWTGDISTLEDVDAAAEARIVDQLVGSLDPSSWLPVFIPVHVDGHRLLVLKIDPSEAPRPLLAGGRGYLKREQRKVPASWFDLRALYMAELPRTPAVPTLQARFLNNASDVSPLLPDGAKHPDCVWRIVAGCPAWPSELQGRHADSSLRDQVRACLKSTAADDWVRRFSQAHELEVPEEWSEVPPSHVGTASFAVVAVRRRGNRAGPRASVHVQVDVASHPHGPSGGGIAATVNLMLWLTELAEDRSIAETRSIQQGRLDQYIPRLDLAEVGAVLDALVSASQEIVSAAQGALLDHASSGLVGPSVWVVGELDKVWDLTTASTRRPASNSLGNHRGFDAPGSFPITASQRELLVDHWLQMLLLTAGFVPEGPVWRTTRE